MRYPLDLDGPGGISDEARDLISQLVCGASTRLDVAGIKAHPFFDSVDWDRLDAMAPPFVPELHGDTDTSYFDTFEEQDAARSMPSYNPPRRAAGSDPGPEAIAFLGFTYNKGVS